MLVRRLAMVGIWTGVNVYFHTCAFVPLWYMECSVCSEFWVKSSICFMPVTATKKIKLVFLLKLVATHTFIARQIEFCLMCFYSIFWYWWNCINSPYIFIWHLTLWGFRNILCFYYHSDHCYHVKTKRENWQQIFYHLSDSWKDFKKQKLKKENRNFGKKRVDKYLTSVLVFIRLLAVKSSCGMNCGSP